ncbi:hypothetical protein ACH4S8_01930 [Streptomyces sp. NPDC021080]|uniref:hypothetical protein n=1 Tax=Streptomyces sp. NPDC021080 TaxID=3365110 RepID=UPI0037A2D28B
MQERLLAEHRASPGGTLADRPDRPILATLRSLDRTDVKSFRKAADSALFLTLIVPLEVQTAARPNVLDHHAWTGWSP